ncbi:MAG: GMC family oxidoreductase [Xanthomonadales bacterium]|nr:GMC family oxidoreductase [Xanthomonadales bacterium]
MIDDIRNQLDNNATAEFDLAIIGAGPAGITIARSLVGRGLRIALLEAGGLEPPTAEELALYDGDVVGLPYPLLASRQRFFGGTSNHWGGWCRPLDASDFEQREWFGVTAWPLSRSDLDPWYRQAHDVVQITTEDYDMSSNTHRNAILNPAPDDDFRDLGFRFSPPTRFGTVYREQLAKANEVDVLLHATVVDLEHDGHVVAAAQVATLDGQRFRINAKVFIVATGGIEVARLLLHTAHDQQPALGNQSGLLGRYFMEHFGYTPGFLMTRAEMKYQRHEGTDDAQLMPVLAPSPRLMKEERLNNCCFMLTATEPDPEWPPEALQAPGIATSLGNSAWRYRVTMINEPTPNRNSRVSLSNQTDELGMRRLVLDWQILERDLEAIERVVARLALWLGRRGLGRLQFSRPISPETTERFSGGMHHMGTARMSRRAQNGVVDENCKVHGVDNLYVAGSAIFPTVGFSNPTLTITALALRLASHLRGVRL